MTDWEPLLHDDGSPYPTLHVAWATDTTGGRAVTRAKLDVGRPTSEDVGMISARIDLAALTEPEQIGAVIALAQLDVIINDPTADIEWTDQTDD